MQNPTYPPMYTLHSEQDTRSFPYGSATHSFIYSLNKWLLSTYNVPGDLLNAARAKEGKKTQVGSR